MLSLLSWMGYIKSNFNICQYIYLSGCSSLLPTFLCLLIITFPLRRTAFIISLHAHMQVTNSLCLFVCNVFIFYFLSWRILNWVQNSTLVIFLPRALKMSFCFLQFSIVSIENAAVLLWFFEKPFVLSLLLRFFSISLKFITFIMLCLCKVLLTYSAWSSYNFMTLWFTSLHQFWKNLGRFLFNYCYCPTVFLISNCTCTELFTFHLSSQLWSSLPTTAQIPFYFCFSLKIYCQRII